MSIVLDDGRTRLVLAPVSQGGGLLQVRHGVHTWFVAEAARSKPPLWRLQLRNRADGSVLELCNVDVPARPGLTWEGSLPDGGPLAVRVLISQSETVEAVIHVHLVSRSWELIHVDFPVTRLRPVPGAAGEITLVLSRAFGRAVRNPFFHASPGFGFGAHFGLPSPGPMQLGALVDDHGRGLYWATHDPQGRPKRFFYIHDPNAVEPVIELQIRHFPDQQAGPVTDYKLPYPVVLKTFEGDWWDAAMIYRAWALHQVWTSAGPLATRADMPGWVLDTHVWASHSGPTVKTGSWPAAFEDFPAAYGTPLGVQWYDWFTCQDPAPSACWTHPWAWPPHPGTASTFDSFAQHDVRVLAYINALVWDVRADDRKEPLVSSGGVRDRAGDLVHWNAGLYPHAHVMCAATDGFAKMLASAARRVVDEGGASGVYLDQLGGQLASDYLCSSDAHSHVPGGGAYPGTGLRQMLVAVRDGMRSVRRDAVIAGEDLPETVVDLVHLRLNHYNAWPGWIPLWAAVYGDYLPSYGRTIHLAGVFAEGAGFYAQAGQCLVAGVAPGRIAIATGPNTWTPDDPSDATWLAAHGARRDFLIDAVAHRKAFSSYLVEGHLQRPVEIETTAPEVELIYRVQVQSDGTVIRYPMTMSPVLASAWVARDGTLGIVFVNISEQVVSFTHRLDRTATEMSHLATQVRVATPATPEGVVVREIPQPLVLAAHEIAVYLVVPPSTVLVVPP